MAVLKARSRPVEFALLLVLALLPASPSLSATLRGNVHSHDGKPIVGAVVEINRVVLPGGPGPKCEWCYPEVGRRAVTDTSGHFEFTGLGDSLLFGLLANAPGFSTAWLPNVPTGAAAFELWPVENVVQDNDAHVRVVDSEANPVFGAWASFSCMPRVRPGMPWRDRIGGVYPWEQTDQFGETICFGCSRVDSTTLEVSAIGYVTARLQVPGAESSYVVRLQRVGATIRGRAVQNGRPLSGVHIVLLRAEDRGDWHMTDGEISTDEAGEFSFPNAVPGLLYHLFVPIADARPFGSFDAVTARAGKQGSIVNAPVLRSHRGHSLAGRIRLPAGASLPRGVRFRLCRMVGVDEGTPSQDAWDAVPGAIDTTGSFRFDNLPAETMLLDLYVPGYALPSSLAAPLRYRRFDQTALVDLKKDYTEVNINMVPLVQPKEHEPGF